MMLRKSFSLVELVIVVVIIGVIAAIAVPRISSSYGRSSENALASDLVTMRKAIDMYAAEHNRAFPGSQPDGGTGMANSAAAFVSQLTQFSAVDGAVSTTKDTQHSFGPYLRKIPILPVGKNKQSTGIAIDTTSSPPVVTAGTEDGSTIRQRARSSPTLMMQISITPKPTTNIDYATLPFDLLRYQIQFRQRIRSLFALRSSNTNPNK